MSDKKSDKKREIRTNTKEFRVRRNDHDQPVLTGHAAVFNAETDIGPFLETIKPGAFRKTLEGSPDIRALINHDTAAVVARTKNGTLRLKEDEVGLSVEIEPNMGTQEGRDLVARVERGDVDQMSFGFFTVEDEWRMKDSRHLRELVELELFEVSPVTFPAYPTTSISARSILDEFLKVDQVDVPEVKEEKKEKEPKDDSKNKETPKRSDEIKASDDSKEKPKEEKVDTTNLEMLKKRIALKKKRR